MTKANKLSVLLTCDPEIPVPPEKYGGIERIVDALVRGLVQRGHNVTLCANEASKVPCRLIPWKGMKSQNLPDTIKNAATLTKFVMRSRVDVIHSFSRLAYMTLLMPASIPKIMSYQREPSLRQIKKAKFLAARDTLLFTGCSDYITNQIRPFASATTVHNAAPFGKFKLGRQTEPDAPLVFLGRIEEIKGTHEAILIAQKTKRRLTIAGNIPAGKEEYFNAKVQPHLNERIRYIGAVDDQQKNALLGKAAALLMPILWDEPFGIVMVEAMACGAPVIGMSRGAVPEVIQHGATGFSCGDFNEMAEAVNLVESLDRSQVRFTAKQRFSEQVMVENYLNIYNRMIIALRNRRGRPKNSQEVE